MKLFCVFFVTLCTLTFCDAAKILFIFNFQAHSHYILGHTLAEELASKGHQVTLVRWSEMNVTSPNLKIVQMDGANEEFLESMGNHTFTLEEMLNFSPYSMATFLHEFGTFVSDLTLRNKNVQKMLKEEKHFDLVVVEHFYTDAMQAFCYHYKAPCIAFSTVGASCINNYLVANPAPSSYVPDLFLDYNSQMTLFQRMHNLVYQTFVRVLSYVYYKPKNNAVIQKHFPNAPYIDEILANTSLVFLNSHFSISQAVPHVTNMIEVGGLHIKISGKIPEDVKKYLDDSKEGVILFSLGSNLKSKDLPIEKRNGILKALSKLKQKVLWKFEDESLTEIPANVKISKWLPQQEILAHPNIKLFISHGGLLSLTESIHFGVPLIGIPFFGDQRMNMAEVARSGVGVQISYNDLNEQSLTNALNEVLSNPSYTEKVKIRSAIMRDRPMKPLDEAVYWVEYLLRHKSASHMSSAALKLNWYQLYQLDVLAILFVIFCVPFVVLVKICKRCKGNKRGNKVEEKKKKRQ